MPSSAGTTSSASTGHLPPGFPPIPEHKEIPPTILASFPGVRRIYDRRVDNTRQAFQDANAARDAMETLYSLLADSSKEEFFQKLNKLAVAVNELNRKKGIFPTFIYIEIRNPKKLLKLSSEMKDFAEKTTTSLAINMLYKNRPFKILPSEPGEVGQDPSHQSQEVTADPNPPSSIPTPPPCSMPNQTLESDSFCPGPKPMTDSPGFVPFDDRVIYLSNGSLSNESLTSIQSSWTNTTEPSQNNFDNQNAQSYFISTVAVKTGRIKSEGNLSSSTGFKIEQTDEDDSSSDDDVVTLYATPNVSSSVISLTDTSDEEDSD